MSEQHESAAAGRDDGHARASVADLLAFLGALVFTGMLTLLADHTGRLPARLAFAGAAGLVAGCVTGWRRLRRPGPRRWRSGQAVYHGRRVTVVSAWGVEGQPLPPIEPTAIEDAVTATPVPHPPLSG